MAYSFDGTADDYLSWSDDAGLDITGALTMSAWVKHDDGAPDANNEGVLAKYLQTGNNRSYNLYLDTGPVAGFVLSSAGTYQSGNDIAGSITLTAGTWYHICGVFNPSTRQETWFDGASVANNTVSVPASIYNGTADLWVACQFTATDSHCMNGDIAECALWSTNLSDGEVAALAAGYSPLLVRPSSLAFYAPLHRNNYLEDYIGGRSGTNNDDDASTAPADHPPIIYPKNGSW